MEDFFTNVYVNKIWGDNNNDEYDGSSGGGSTIEFNQDDYVPFLKKYIVNNNIKNIVDLGCGDFKCGKLIYDDLDISYTGYDAYKKIIDYNLKQHSFPKYSFIQLVDPLVKESLMASHPIIHKVSFDEFQYIAWPLSKLLSFPLKYIALSFKRISLEKTVVV